MKRQNKATEITVSGTVPEEEWLEDSQEYRARRAHLELLQLISSQGQLILDAGCGPGTYGIMSARDGNQVIGVEISSESVAVAKERANEKGVKFSPLVGDLESLPFKDNSFDICFCSISLSVCAAFSF